MDDGELYAEVAAAAKAGRPAALATVVATRGSVPRHAGSKMLVEPDAGIIGTIGGGCGEADVIAAAKSVIESGTPRLIRVELMDEIDSWSPAVCGGTMDIFLEPVTPAPVQGAEKGSAGDTGT
jgi:xanthine dehydrogenase accessory factor